MEHRKSVNLSPFIQLANNNHKLNEKRCQEYQSMDPEYVTGELMVIFWSFFSDNLVV